MRHWKDKWLVQRILSGDKAAGEQFVIEHYEAIFSVSAELDREQRRR